MSTPVPRNPRSLGRTLPIALCGALCGALIGAPRTASAQAAGAGAGAGGTATPSDVVALKNGGMLRGTISELNPKGDVVLVTVTGETRRIPMSEVAYAGPVASAPSDSGSRPIVRVEGKDARITFASTQPDLTLHMHVGDATATSSSMYGVVHSQGKTYARVCTAPCEATVRAGAYRMAVSRGHGSPIEVEDMVHVPGPSTLAATYHSYAEVRAIGFVVVLGSAVTGVYLALSSFHSAQCGGGTCEDARVEQGRLLTGLAVLIGGGIVGSVLAGKSDTSEIRVVPAAVGALRGGGSSWSRGGLSQNVDRGVGAATLPGLTLYGSF